jgi:hypothetical protein
LYWPLPGFAHFGWLSEASQILMVPSALAEAMRWPSELK